MTTMSCDRCRELLVSDESQDGRLLTKHLDTCPECAAFAGDLDRLQALARELPRPEAPAARISARPPRRSIQTRRLVAGLAVGVGVLLVVGGLWLLVGPGLIGGSGSADSGSPLSMLMFETHEVDLLAAIDNAQQVWARSPGLHEGWSWLDLPVASVSYARLPRTDLLDPLDLEHETGFIFTFNGGLP